MKKNKTVSRILFNDLCDDYSLLLTRLNFIVAGTDTTGDL